jgi:hypothetical protein
MTGVILARRNLATDLYRGKNMEDIWRRWPSSSQEEEVSEETNPEDTLIPLSES